MVKRYFLVFLLILLSAPFSIAINVRQEYAGKSSCSPGLERGIGSYGIRLDKSQKARLEARTNDGRDVLMIIQYSEEGDECGVVRDIVQSRDHKAVFVFECVNPKSPSALVVGTWPVGSKQTSGPALESWQIELNGLEFVPLTGRVNCISRSFAGNDDGSDLVIWAKQRAAKKRLSKRNDQGAR